MAMLGELLRREQRLAAPVRPVGIGLDHHRRPAVEHAVIEQLDHAGATAIRNGSVSAIADALSSMSSVMKFLKWNGIWARQQQAALGLDLGQQFELVEVAVHVLDRGDAVAGRTSPGRAA